jgi:4-hydroxy-tetrahydrodipicolinate reductase
MQLLICGPGRLGGAIAAAAVAVRWPAPRLVGRPDGRRVRCVRTGGHRRRRVRRRCVAGNLAEAIAAGHRRFVLAATGWDADLPRVRALLLEHDAAAVVAPNLSLGAALFARLVETAAGWYGRAGAFEPSIVEWHRRGKADRPSGTARALARRVAAADPRWSAGTGPHDASVADAGDARPAIEVVGIRAGAAPGTHLVTFDGSGESVELRLTARDRTAYADGALAAARWLTREPRAAGLHPFDAVVDDLLSATPDAVHA